MGQQLREAGVYTFPVLEEATDLKDNKVHITNNTFNVAIGHFLQCTMVLQVILTEMEPKTLLSREW